MDTITTTMKLHIHATKDDIIAFKLMTQTYMDACNEISEYVFNNGLIMNSNKLQSKLYKHVRETYPLKAQLTVSTFKTVTARYKTVDTQMNQNPKKMYVDGKRYSVKRDIQWLQKPIHFSRPQADLVRNRDYDFLTVDGTPVISINTLGNRVKCTYDVPKYYQQYFMNPDWKFGTAKLVSLKGKWYLHIPVTRVIEHEFDDKAPKHIVGIDRGLRFLATLYDDDGKTWFISGRDIIKRREAFERQREELQRRGTKSAKRALKRLAGREKRWMSDVNHRITKALVEHYGPGTLFVIEDLAGVSFADGNLRKRASDGRRELRSWAFYQCEQYLAYKAAGMGSGVLKVAPDYTSQRCPRCGRILKENRRRDDHEYVCDACGYRSNDDRSAAMNIRLLGTMYVSGDEHPRFGHRHGSGDADECLVE